MAIAIDTAAAQVNQLQRGFPGAFLERISQQLQTPKEGLPIVMDINVGGLGGCKLHQDAIKAFSKGEAGAGIRGIEKHWSINKLSQRG